MEKGQKIVLGLPRGSVGPGNAYNRRRALIEGSKPRIQFKEVLGGLSELKDLPLSESFKTLEPLILKFEAKVDFLIECYDDLIKRISTSVSISTLVPAASLAEIFLVRKSLSDYSFYLHQVKQEIRKLK
jgi:hypothetical protein